MSYLNYLLSALIIILINGCHQFNSQHSILTKRKSHYEWKHIKSPKQSCSSCHEAFRPKSKNGIKHGNNGDCKICHVYRDSFGNNIQSTWKVISENHSFKQKQSCSACHLKDRPLSNPHKKNQIGMSNDCSICHVPGNWKPAEFNHQNYLGKCNVCHGVNAKEAQGSYSGLNDRPFPKNSHPTKYYNALDCKYCHQKKSDNSIKSNKVTADWGKQFLIFDHSSHTPKPITCSNCHLKRRNEIEKSSGRPHSRGDCVSCHKSMDRWSEKIVGFDHEISKPRKCISCHENKQPYPRPKDHPGKNQYKKLECNLCHTYKKTSRKRSWKYINFNDNTHSPYPSTCVSCHKNEISDSRPVSQTHNRGPRSTNSCKDCHIFSIKIKKGNRWKNFTKNVHQFVNDVTCISCHNKNQKTIESKQSAIEHLKTTKDCKSCHQVSGWYPASGGTRPANHFKTTQYLTTQSCTFCHKNSNQNSQTKWKIPNFKKSYDHSSLGSYPGDHRFGNKCSKCHQENSDQVKWKSSLYQKSCAACHAKDFEPREHRRSLKSLQDCGRCHRVNRRRF